MSESGRRSRKPSAVVLENREIEQGAGRGRGAKRGRGGGVRSRGRGGGVKRVVAPARQADEQARPTRVIVINPGSHSLRIGFAEDVEPKVVPHVVAHRRAKSPPEEKRQVNADSTAAALAEVRVEGAEAGGELDWAEEVDGRVAYGERAVRAPAGWTQRRPMRRGQLNVSDAYALLEVMDDMQGLWEHALVDVLGVVVPVRAPLRTPDMGEYAAVLVLPQSLTRREVALLVDLALRRLRFAALMVQEEAPCAAYGFGVSYACVVDVGRERTCVSCFAEGGIEPASRLVLPVGGLDISALVLRGATVPDGLLEAPDVFADPHAARLGDWLKERHARFDAACPRVSATVAMPGGRTARVEVAEALCVAPRVLFDPPLRAGFPGSSPAAAAMRRDLADFGYADDDPFGADLLGPDAALPESPLSACAPPIPFDGPLHDAVAASIEAMPRRDQRRRLYAAVLLTGAGSLVPGLPDVLAARLRDRTPRDDAEPDPVTVIVESTLVSGAPPPRVAWLGGCIVANLDTASPFWLTRDLWFNRGFIALDERLVM